MAFTTEIKSTTPIPAPPGGEGAEFFIAMQGILSEGLGQQGDPDKRFITLEDLTDPELVKYLNSQEVSVTRPVPAMQDHGVLTDRIPDPPRDLITLKDDEAGRINAFNHVLKWTNPGVAGVDLVSNGSFETGDPPTGWIAGNDADLDRHADPNTGTYCLEINENGTSYPFAYQVVSVETGKTYTYSTYLKQGTGTTSRVSVWDVQNAVTLWEEYPTATAAYVKFSRRFTIPAGCTSIQVVMYHYGLAASGTNVLFDDTQLRKVLTPASDETDYSHVEVWVSESNSRSAAVLTGIVTYPGNMYTHMSPNPTKDYYYWIRMVNWSGQYSTWEPTSDQGGYVVAGADSINDTVEKLMDSLKGEEPAAYEAGTEYTSGDRCSYTSGVNTRRYKCIATTTGNLPTDTTYWVRSGILLEGEVDGEAIIGVDGNMVVDGTIVTRNLDANCVTAGVIAAGTITATEIAANTITAAEIAAGTLTATEIKGTAFGTLTITSGKISINTTDALEIQAAGNINCLAGSDIIFVGSDSDPGNMLFEGSSYDVKFGGDAAGDNFYLTPTTHNVTNLLIGTGAPWASGTLPASLQLFSCDEVLIKAQHPTHPSPNTYTRIIAGATTTESDAWISTTFEGTTRSIRALQTSSLLELYPVGNKLWNLGNSGNAWDDVYADDFNNVADFYYLDDRDDMAAIRAIKGSGEISSVTGLELIDDNTIPNWMLSRHKRDGEDWKRGDVMHTDDGDPYLSLKLLTSLCMGALRQLDARIEKLENSI